MQKVPLKETTMTDAQRAALQDGYGYAKFLAEEFGAFEGRDLTMSEANHLAIKNARAAGYKGPLFTKHPRKERGKILAKVLEVWAYGLNVDVETGNVYGVDGKLEHQR